MHFYKFLILLIACLSCSSLFAQTDTTGLNRDSAAASPVSRIPAVVRKDTTVGPSVKPAKGKTVVKDSARLALEALPKKAAWSSTIVPGWGQIRNKRWWKVPIIYGGLISVGLAFEFNNRYYREILSELQYRTEPNKFPKPKNSDRYTNIETQSLTTAKDFYRRNRDLSVLGFAAVHALNIIDAYVDAKFFRYDISDRLGFSVKPTLLQQQNSYAYKLPVPGIKLSFPL